MICICHSSQSLTRPITPDAFRQPASGERLGLPSCSRQRSPSRHFLCLSSMHGPSSKRLAGLGESTLSWGQRWWWLLAFAGNFWFCWFLAGFSLNFKLGCHEPLSFKLLGSSTRFGWPEQIHCHKKKNTASSGTSCLLSVVRRGSSFPLMLILKLQTCTDYAVLPISFAISFPGLKHCFLHGCSIRRARAASAPRRSLSRLHESQEKLSKSHCYQSSICVLGSIWRKYVLLPPSCFHLNPSLTSQWNFPAGKSNSISPQGSWGDNCLATSKFYYTERYSFCFPSDWFSSSALYQSMHLLLYFLLVSYATWCWVWRCENREAQLSAAVTWRDTDKAKPHGTKTWKCMC